MAPLANVQCALILIERGQREEMVHGEGYIVRIVAKSRVLGHVLTNLGEFPIFIDVLINFYLGDNDDVARMVDLVELEKTFGSRVACIVISESLIKH